MSHIGADLLKCHLLGLHRAGGAALDEGVGLRRELLGLVVLGPSSLGAANHVTVGESCVEFAEDQSVAVLVLHIEVVAVLVNSHQVAGNLIVSAFGLGVEFVNVGDLRGLHLAATGLLHLDWQQLIDGVGSLAVRADDGNHVILLAVAGDGGAHVVVVGIAHAALADDVAAAERGVLQLHQVAEQVVAECSGGEVLRRHLHGARRGLEVGGILQFGLAVPSGLGTGTAGGNHSAAAILLTHVAVDEHIAGVVLGKQALAALRKSRQGAHRGSRVVLESVELSNSDAVANRRLGSSGLILDRQELERDALGILGLVGTHDTIDINGRVIDEVGGGIA